jgi:hypothetical protein
MTPEEFIAKWRGSELSERAAAHSHFIDLCSVLGVPIPTPASAAEYAFEKPTRKIGNTQGFADVWKRGASRGNTSVTAATSSKPTRS